MGETGCGKTFLIRMISQVYHIELRIKNVHAGTTEKDIIDFMEGVIEETKIYGRIWVFFDEINTSNAIGLIAEIMCNRTIQGKTLPKNLIFIAACNPYRKRKNNNTFNFGLVYKKSKNKELVYNVIPLPHSLINFVFDFGSLSEADEKRYIKSMVNQVNIGNSTLEKYAIEMISFCQYYIRRENEVSSVSLRDARRFVTLYDWFIKSISQRENIEIDDN